MAAPSLASPSSPVSTRRAQRRLWLRRLVGFFVLVVVALICAWGFRDDAISPVAPKPEAPLVAETLTQTVFKDGKRLWQFHAAKFEMSPDGSQTFAHDVSNGILFRDNKPFIYLSAPLVHLENNSNNVDASGGVSASTGERFAVSSQMVRWNYEQKRLTCPTPVKAHLRDFTFEAPYLSYKWDTGGLSCDAPVELRAQGVRLQGTHLHASTKTKVLELGSGDFSFDVHKARPDKWKNLLVLPK